jgi:diguanylate cyclase (GGDEF)-like protein
VLIVVRDVTDRRELEEQLTYQALHDPLTGLANRTLFQDRAAHALASAGRDGRSCAVLLIDLDNFKPVNDGLGHAAGDQLLRIVADRLRAVARETDTVARLGGDEFAVLLEAPVESPGDAAVAAERILAELNQPVQLAGTTVELSASLGLAHNTATGSSELDALLRAADSAMYAAKKAGKGRMRTGGRGRS